MKKIASILLTVIIMTLFTTGCNAQPQDNGQTQSELITLQIGNPIITIGNNEIEIDPGRDTVPIILNERTLLPIRAVVEAMGGTVAWDEAAQTTILAKEDSIILLTIGSKTAFLNETEISLDTAPIIENERTMLPIRFIAESFGYSVEWDENTQTVTLTLTNGTPSESRPTVAMPMDNEAINGSIVIYFSQTGTTEKLALQIAELTGSEIYKIVPEVEYTAEDINYGNNNSRANREQNDDTVRPAISGKKINLAEYNTIYLGYPIWWGTAPRIIQTFMDSYDLSGKTILPFCTSHSSGISTSVSLIRSYCPTANVKDGFRGSSQTNENEIINWIENGGV